jgi:hydrogenase nickel incorporation protein HypA/HybF
MHEVGVMTSILEAVLEELQGHEIIEVEEILLTVGELTYLGEDQLSFAFEILTKGTILEGSILVIEQEAVELKCHSCGYHGVANYYQDGMQGYKVPTLDCPQCGARAEVTKGKGCTVRSIKVVEQDVPV